MARRPKPTQLKLIQGNAGKRPLPEAEPELPPTGLLEPPAQLAPEAAEFWRRILPVLTGMGVLTAADLPALERLCECYAEIRRYQAALDKHRDVYKTKSRTGAVMIRARPERAMLADADRRFAGYLGHFGLTPAARAKVKVNSGKETDPAARFFA